jgi:type IV pilus assembly protein PilV
MSVSSKHTRQSGVSIVEALVALVILSVGMLGIAGLYLTSVQANRTAQTRTAAVYLINDMGDRIRTNRTAMASYATALGAVPPTATSCVAANCTPTQMAANDLRALYDAAIGNTNHILPTSPDGTAPQMGVTYTPGATTVDPARLVITLQWKEPGSTDWLSTNLEIVQLGTI